jgi:two-component system response regulator AtoC
MFQIALPPLRERHADVRDLVHFLLQNVRDVGRAGPVEIDSDAEAILIAYPWPGNVRELDNVINRARILSEDNRITVADLPASIVGTQPALAGDVGGEATLRLQLRRHEIKLLQDAIAAAAGDRRVAAEKLGISLSSLYRKVGEAP